MNCNNFEDDDYYEEKQDINDFQITHIYILRHPCNIFGEKAISSKLKIDIKRIIALYESGIHGSVELKQFISQTDETKFQELIKHFEEENPNRKNAELVLDLKKRRSNFANIGTNKAKRFLNKLGLTLPIARALRLALEIEDKNIVAKGTYGDYIQKTYHKKEELILKLCEIFKEQKWVYGIQKSNNISASHVIYFEIPNCEQISWHFNPPYSDFPQYGGNWDGKKNSTLNKLEIAYNNLTI